MRQLRVAARTSRLPGLVHGGRCWGSRDDSSMGREEGGAEEKWSLGLSSVSAWGGSRESVQKSDTNMGLACECR